jgi:hypothetical protein
MPPITQVFGHVLAADAGLACVTWIHSYHRTSSFSVSRARAAIERLQTLAKVLTPHQVCGWHVTVRTRHAHVSLEIESQAQLWRFDTDVGLDGLQEGHGESPDAHWRLYGAA